MYRNDYIGPTPNGSILPAEEGEWSMLELGGSDGLAGARESLLNSVSGVVVSDKDRSEGETVGSNGRALGGCLRSCAGPRTEPHGLS